MNIENRIQKLEQRRASKRPLKVAVNFVDLEAFEERPRSERRLWAYYTKTNDDDTLPPDKPKAQ